MLLITGASGRVGRRTAELVLGKLGHQAGALRLMTRTPEKLREFTGADIVSGDFSRLETLASAFRGIDTALVISSAAPPGERALHHRGAFRAAAAAGVRHVVYVSLQGSGPRSRFSYSRDHATSEQFLAESGVPEHTILRNAFYLDMLPGFFDAGGVLCDPSAGGRAALIAREDAAQALAAALLDPPGGVLDVTGPEAIDLADAVARLARLTGRPLHYAHVPAQPHASGNGPAAENWRAELYTGWFKAVAAGELAHPSDVVRRLTGRAPLTLEQYFSAFPEALALLRPGPVPARAQP